MEMERANSLGVRKGAWSKEEDALLKKCVQQFGEGRWHLVPLRTGLNRCRKSCRLRWLNYLRPNITRGNFTKDEIDLLIRLHKLLGNRWSLIAGRIPGRTANDVKNFWNTRMEKKSGGEKIQKTITKTNILRPRPRNFSTHGNDNSSINNKLQPSSNLLNPSPSSSSREPDIECIRWWSNLLDTADQDELGEHLPFLDDHKVLEEDKGLFTGSQINPMDDGTDDSTPPNELTHDFGFHDDVWELLGFGNHEINKLQD